MPLNVIPRLSIVVPFYNVERYIGPCLDSLARQTFRDFEVVLVDDGSKDGSADIARAYCADDPRFRLVVQENQGLGPARNTGVEHAQGEYLTFVDSDDLIPRHAYEIMVRSLDETSSSLAGGNARRFNNTSGVRHSYVHRLAYAQNRPATHVLEFPKLATDRMVWNKVYRRRFWDQFKYKFPAIRYEDYPVTLKAHIEAVTVDCLAAPTYYWRERESGESITQLKFQIGNLEDRVVSAEMVLDVVARQAPELRQEVHSHLALIDLTTVVQAFGSAPEHELEKVLELGRRLTRRLDPKVFERVSAFQRLEYYGLQSGDVELLQRLARFRAEGGLAAGSLAERHPVLPWRYKGRYPGLPNTSGVPAEIYRLSRKDIQLRAAATEVRWEADALVVRGTAEISHLPASDDMAVQVALVIGLRETPLEVERVELPNATGESRPVGWKARVPSSLLGALAANREVVQLMATMRNGQVRRKRIITMQMQYPVGQRIGDAWFQPVRANDGRLLVRRMAGDPELTGAAADGDALVLSGVLPAGSEERVLRLTRAAKEIRVPLEVGAGNTWTARVEVGEVVDSTSPDDPFLGRTVLVPKIGGSLILITGLSRAVSVPHGDRVLSISRSPGQYLNLIEAPARVVTTGLGIEGTILTVDGPRWPGVDYDRISWRRFLPGTDDYVDARCRVVLDGDRWTGVVDLADVGPVEDADWTLFADPAGDEPPYAVQIESFALVGLPLRVDRYYLFARAGTLHLETS